MRGFQKEHSKTLLFIYNIWVLTSYVLQVLSTQIILC